MSKVPEIVQKIELNIPSDKDKRPFTQKYTREEYVSSNPGSEREIRNKIYDQQLVMDSEEYKLMHWRERKKVFDEFRRLHKLVDFDLSKYREDGGLSSFGSMEEDIRIDEFGIDENDDYCYKNWHGHDS